MLPSPLLSDLPICWHELRISSAHDVEVVIIFGAQTCDVCKDGLVFLARGHS